MAGRLQNEDIKSVAELASQGCGPEKLPNDDKVYVTANGLNKTLKEAIEAGNLSGGGGSDAISKDGGDVTVQLKPTIVPWIIQAPDTSLWEVSVDNNGILSVSDGAAGTPTELRVTRPDSTQVEIAITNAGELQVVNPAVGGTLNNQFYLQAPDGNVWKIGVTNLDEIQTSDDAGKVNFFKITNEAGTALFAVKEVNGLALLYANVFNAGNLPAAPAVIASTLPFAFYDDGANKRLVYHDGVSWKYVHDNSAV